MKYLLILPFICIAICTRAQTNLDSLRSRDVAYQVVVINGVEHNHDGVNAYIEPPDPHWQFGLTDLRKLQADLKLLHSYDEVYNYMVANYWQYLDKTTDKITSLTEFTVRFRKVNPYFNKTNDPATPAEPKTAKEKRAEERAARKEAALKAKQEKQAKAVKEKEEKQPKEKKPKEKPKAKEPKEEKQRRKVRVTDG